MSNKFHLSCNQCWSTDVQHINGRNLIGEKFYQCNECGSFFDDNNLGVQNVIGHNGQNIRTESETIKDK
jgi:uncharacterized Zn finger protein